MNWGACYFDHFTKLFREPTARQTFSQDPAEHTIQILAYDRVFRDCRVFASLGLSHYALEVGKTAEIIVPVDDGWELVPAALGNVLFYMVQTGLPVDRGVAVAGLKKTNVEFARQFHKEALYVTNLYGLPQGAESVLCDEHVGSLYLGMFLSEAEYLLFLERGADDLESILQDTGIDPFDLRRDSCI